MRYSKKAQMKIQQMAFVLVAIMIFFVLVGLLFISIRVGALNKSAQTLKDESARELVRKLSNTPEFIWSDCPGCVDGDKLLVLKENVGNYKDIWKLDYLTLEFVYPSKDKTECNLINYPNCNKITLINGSGEYGLSSSAYVSICSWDKEGYTKCELGKLSASGEGIK